MKTYFTLGIFILFLFFPFWSKAQLITISGIVTDGNSGDRIENVNIFESTSNIGTISNYSGFYKLELEAGELDLKISANNFKDYVKKITLRKDTVLAVELIPEQANKIRGKKYSDSRVGKTEFKGFAYRNQ